VIVAGTENPAIRNSQVFFMHLFTSNQESLLTEFGLRLWNNISLYAAMTGKLLFMPDFGQRSLSLVAANDPVVALFFSAMPSGRFVLIGASFGFCLLGILQEFKERKPFALLGIVLFCYLLPILLYPINDIRFLFPLLIVMVYFCAVGLYSADEWRVKHMRFRGASLAMYAACVFFLLPNIVWIQSYVRSSYQYGRSPEQMYARTNTESEYPGQFAKPLHLAGEWIVQHDPSPVVVLSRWKELAFWLDGRKVVDAHPQITPDAFEHLLRDYSVKYLVAVISRVGLSEFESVMARSTHYSFVPVYRACDAEVFEVRARNELVGGETEELASDTTARSLFRKALAVLEEKPQEARQLLERIPVRIGGYSEIMLQRGVALELSGELDSALVQFEKFRSMPQAGAYLQQASYHLELISRLKSAMVSTNTIQRAEMYQTVAVSCWERGYRRQAMALLSRSLDTEPQFFPALIISALFSFQQGDTASAWFSLNKARTLQPDNILTSGLTSVQQGCELLRSSKDKGQQIGLRLKIAESFIEMGMRDLATDDLYSVLALDPANRRALQLLGESFEAKQRYEPALRCYNSILLSDVTNREARQKVKELLARF
jgi:tetratricopeptide (TPR) repeat protein